MTTPQPTTPTLQAPTTMLTQDGQTVVLVPQGQRNRAYSEDELYAWSGDEHGAECPLHADNVKAAKAAWKKAKTKNPAAKPPACKQLDACCPDDLVVNAGSQPLIVGAQAQVPWDNAKILPGDRRRGGYYLDLLKKHQAPGLMRLSSVPMTRRVELEKLRKLRTGDEPNEWVKEAWSKLSDADRRKMEEQGLGGDDNQE